MLARGLAQPAGERPDPFDEPVEERRRVDVNADAAHWVSRRCDQSVTVMPRVSVPVSSTSTVAGRVATSSWIQRDRGGQRVVLMRHISVPLVVVALQIEPCRVLDHPDQRIGRRRPGAPFVVHAHRRCRRPGGGRQSWRGFSGVIATVRVRFKPHRIGRCVGSAVFGSPGREHLGGRLGVHADVPFGDRRWCCPGGRRSRP